MSELSSLTAFELNQLLKDKKISSVELTKSVICRIKNYDLKIKAYITVDEEGSLKEARQADEFIKNNKYFSLLCGIPVSIKDNICTSGLKTTCASRFLENFIPPYDATVVRKLKENKAVIVGKTNMDEFAMGSSTEHSAFFLTKNPWDLERVPGGSSGGSAASVSADEAVLSLGSDTGGSIRQPAAFCSVVGLKPTYGLVSRYGLVAFASSLDQIGPLAKSVRDCASLLNVISGFDSYDSTSLDIETPDYTKNLERPVKGIRIGIYSEFFKSLDDNMKNIFIRAQKLLEGLGAEILEVDLPNSKYALAAYYIIAPSEASSNLARFDGARYGYRYKDDKSDVFEMFKKTRGEGFGPEVKRRIMTGTYALSAGYYEAYYLKAQKVRTVIKHDFDEAFKKCDLILTPATPSPPFKIGENIQDPVKMYLSDIFSVPVNLAGLPAISIPAGFIDNLPVGMQLIGKPLSEELILNVSHLFEKEASLSKKPKL